MITSYFKTKQKTNSSSADEDKKVQTPNHSGTKHRLSDETPESNDGDDNAKDEEEISNNKSDNKRMKITDSDPKVESKSSTDDKYSKISCTEVIDLLSHLKDESWRAKIFNHVSKPSFAKLAKFVAKERASKIVYPPPSDVFSSLNSLPIDKVKVVIVGQDPYHQPNQGHGLAFSVRKGVRIPPSLRNIYKELLTNTNCGLEKMPKHGYLEQWSAQGVLLLNAVLTVRKSEANSHAKRGWEDFTDEIIRILVSDKQRQFVFLLWGKPAAKKTETIMNRFGKGRHTIIASSHPSPLGATKTKAPFIGSKCFSRANDALVKMGQEPIDWGIDE